MRVCSKGCFSSSSHTCLCICARSNPLDIYFFALLGHTIAGCISLSLCVCVCVSSTDLVEAHHMHGMPERNFVLQRVLVQRAVPRTVVGIIRVERAAIVATWADSRHLTIELLQAVSELCQHICAVFGRCLRRLLTGRRAIATCTSRFRGLAVCRGGRRR